MKIFTFLLILLLLAGGVYFFFFRSDTTEIIQEDITPPVEFTFDDEPEEIIIEEPIVEYMTQTTLGTSVEGAPITAYHYGNGPTEILFVGGMHGGYSWNTALVAYELMDYLEATPTIVPQNVTVTVIPVLNPDGLKKVTGTTERFTFSDVDTTESVRVSGRFNANDVDLNRNFDCDWQANATWQNRAVSGGTEAFSEPEARALKQYVETRQPTASVVWYSAVGGVFASNCRNGVLPETRTLTNLYADASGYQSYEEFDFYEITGDAVNWLAKNNIPAISVLLTTHTDTEWTRNKAGIDALLQYYGQ
jgi:murein tripeptide amidase MpaA